MTRKDGELRANKHYVVAPPSVHRSGKQYRWVRGFDTLADVPAITLEESGFGRDWLGTDDQAPEPMPQIGTESVSVRSVSIFGSPMDCSKGRSLQPTASGGVDCLNWLGVFMRTRSCGTFRYLN